MLFKRKNTQEVIYKDDFEDSIDNWEESENADQSDYYSQGNYRLDQVPEETYTSRSQRHSMNQHKIQDEISQVYYEADDHDHEIELPHKRAKYSAKVDRFLNSGIIIVGVLLICVLLIAFLV